jgi:hypothetical protein
MPNRQLDANITAALESEAVITRAQREAAWASVRARAAQQVILAPYAIPPRRPPRLSLPARLLLAVRRTLALTATDSIPYDRAALQRDSLQRATWIPGRPAFSSSLIYYYHPSTLLRVGLF